MKGVVGEVIIKVFWLLIIAILIVMLICVIQGGIEASECLEEYNNEESLRDLFKKINNSEEGFVEVNIPVCMWGSALFYEEEGDLKGYLMIQFRSIVKLVKDSATWGIILGVLFAIGGIALTIWTGGAGAPTLLGALTTAGKAISSGLIWFAVGFAIGSSATAYLEVKNDLNLLDMTWINVTEVYPNASFKKFDDIPGKGDKALMCCHHYNISVSVNEKIVVENIADLGGDFCRSSDREWCKFQKG